MMQQGGGGYRNVSVIFFYLFLILKKVVRFFKNLVFQNCPYFHSCLILISNLHLFQQRNWNNQWNNQWAYQGKSYLSIVETCPLRVRLAKMLIFKCVLLR